MNYHFYEEFIFSQNETIFCPDRINKTAYFYDWMKFNLTGVNCCCKKQPYTTTGLYEANNWKSKKVIQYSIFMASASYGCHYSVTMQMVLLSQLTKLITRLWVHDRRTKVLFIYFLVSTNEKNSNAYQQFPLH